MNKRIQYIFKYIIKMIMIIGIAVPLLCPHISINIQAAELAESNLNAKSALLMDADSRRVLYEKNGYQQMPMASTTKIMTCLLALEQADMQDVVEFSANAASMPKVHLGAPKGTKFYMGDMLYSLMLESHNDTAVAIAESIAGDTLSFANMMNERAKQIGAKNTNFVTPNGLDAEQHYTTAYDLALIAAEAVKNEEFLKIVNTASHSFRDVEGKRQYVAGNKDAFLSMMNGAIGIKTGFTGNAGYCFVGALKRDNRTFISVVLASGWPPNKSFKWKDTIKLMNYGIDNYNYRVIFNDINDYKTIEVINGQSKYVQTYIKGNVSTLLSDKDVVEYVYELPPGEVLEAPVQENQVIGRVKILINGEEFQRFDICTRGSVRKIDMRFSFRRILKKFLLT